MNKKFDWEYGSLHKKEYDKKLLQKYPWLKFRNRWTGELINLDGTELDNLDRGWRIAFGDEMVKAIDKLLVKYNYVDKYRILQIKEKYGGLRWYTGSMPSKLFHKHNKLLSKYEKLSLKTCFYCGALTKYHTEGWILPVCEKRFKTGKCTGI